MSDIFVSYSSGERSRVLPLVNALERTGWSVFWDRTIPAGKTWRQVIGAEIRTCRSVLVVWTESSVTSEWVLEEAETGKRRQILIPVLLDEVEPPFGFGTIQAAHLASWDGEVSSAPFIRLIADIAAVLGPPPAMAKIAREDRLRKEEDLGDGEDARVGKGTEEKPGEKNESPSQNRTAVEKHVGRKLNFSWKVGFGGFSALFTVTLMCIVAIYLTLSQSPLPIDQTPQPKISENPASEERIPVQAPPTTPRPQEQIAARPEEKIAPQKEIVPEVPVKELKKEKPIAPRPVVEEAKRKGGEKRPQAKVVEPAKKNKVDARVGGAQVTLRTAEAAGRVVNLRNVSSTEAGDVSGEVVNNSKQTLRDVRLQILYSWRWKNEHQPGKDDPGKAIYHVLDKEIPPGQTVRFRYQPSPPFTSRDDGQFDIGVKIVGFAEVFPGDNPG